MINPVTQVDIHSIAENEQINLSPTIGNWQFSEDGICQLVKSGTKASASGTILLYRLGQPPAMQRIDMRARPASIYYTGIVFNYQDKKNFCLFAVNRGAGTSGYYTIDIGEVVDGDYRNKCREKHFDNLSPLAAFSIRNELGRSVFEINDETVFRWEGMQCSTMLGIGLYSQQNNDAVFREFRAFSSPDVAPTNPLQIPVLSPVVTDNEANESERPINTFLNLKKPSSKTIVEFSETFTVPLDSFYTSLGEVINGVRTSLEKDLANKKLETLDLRPKRWYRQLRAVDNLLETLTILSESKKKKRDKGKESLDNELGKEDATKESIKAAEDDLTKFNDELQFVLYDIEKTQDIKALLLREIRTNGFSVGDITNSRISAMGFNFEISKPIPDVPISKKIVYPEDLDLADDKIWADLEAKLYSELFINGSIRQSAKDLYTLERDQLRSRQDFGKLNSELESVTREIEMLEQNLISLDVDGKEYRNAIRNYEDLIPLLDKERLTYIPYNAADYPLQGAPTTSPNALREYTKLLDWVATFHVENPDSEQNKALGLDVEYAKAAALVRTSNFSTDTPTLYDLNGLKFIAAKFPITISGVRGTYFYLSLPPDKRFNLSATTRLFLIYEPTPTTYSVTVGAMTQSNSIQEFFKAIDKRCLMYIDGYRQLLNPITLKQEKMEADISLNKIILDQLKTKAMRAEREKFLRFWNDPYNTTVRNIHYEIIFPDVDPLAEFLIKLEGDKEKPLKTYYFNPTENGYTNQFGQSLLDFINSKYLSLENSVSLFPVLEANGNFSEELIKIVKNPKKSETLPDLPIVKFIETYKITIGWQGYGLGELSHSVNLFPGESKELVVEKKTKITSKTEESRKQGTETKQNVTSSFEDNLSDTFSEENKTANKAESKAGSNATSSGSAESGQTRDLSSTLNWNVEAKADWGWGSLSGGASGTSSQKSTSTQNNKKAFSLAQNNEGLRASNQSKDVLKKNISNTVKKVANETSVNNKLEFSSVSSQEFQTEMGNKEVIKLENPNVGRTVNYNFFQVQNLYGVTMSLTDVKIVINTGNEVIDGTGINDLRVYELEEFGKIFANSSQTDHDILVASIIARQVMKHYGNFLPGITVGNGAIRLPAGYTPNRESLAILNYTSPELAKGFTREALIAKLELALNELKAMPFYFNETEIQSETTVSVNAGAYHLEAQVGLIPATEKYLEDRREIETEQKKAELAHLQAQTRKEVFHQAIPSTVTHLNYLNSVEKE